MNKVSFKDVDELRDNGGHFEHDNSNRPGRDDLRNRVDPRKIKKEYRKDYSDTLFDKDLKMAAYLNDIEILNCISNKAKYAVITDDMITFYFENGSKISAHITDTLKDLAESGIEIDGVKYFIFPFTENNLIDFCRKYLKKEKFNVSDLNEDFKTRELADSIFLTLINHGE